MLSCLLSALTQGVSLDSSLLPASQPWPHLAWISSLPGSTSDLPSGPVLPRLPQLGIPSVQPDITVCSYVSGPARPVRVWAPPGKSLAPRTGSAWGRGKEAGCPQEPSQAIYQATSWAEALSATYLPLALSVRAVVRNVPPGGAVSRLIQSHSECQWLWSLGRAPQRAAPPQRHFRLTGGTPPTCTKAAIGTQHSQWLLPSFTH